MQQSRKRTLTVNDPNYMQMKKWFDTKVSLPAEFSTLLPPPTFLQLEPYERLNLDTIYPTHIQEPSEIE